MNISPARSRSTDSHRSSVSTTSSLKKPVRTARFNEATAVISPDDNRPMPFSQKSELAQSQPADVGFGYISSPAERESVMMPMTPGSPLRSALKTPGTAGKGLLSPTFREEQLLESQEKATDKEQARDFKIKVRVRMAKLALRGVNFSCSLIVISMMSSAFAIFNATKALPAENNLPPWASNTNAWPQKVVLGASCFSLVVSSCVLLAYRKGHKRAEKVGVYYTLFAVGYSIFSLILWCLAAGIFQMSRNNGNNQDLWGWSCVQNQRSTLFSDRVNYALVCELQSWSLVCILIEIAVEVMTISLYAVVFYRYYTKQRLYKSMDMRDKARSDLYLAQLRTQSAPNTPGLGPKTPAGFSQYALSPRFPPSAYQSIGDVASDGNPLPFTPRGNSLVAPPSRFGHQHGQMTQPLAAGAAAAGQGGLFSGFKLQAPPTKANPAVPSSSPKIGCLSNERGWEESPSGAATQQLPAAPNVNHNAPVAEGEQQYEAVPIPGAYAGQVIRSPPPAHTSFGLNP